ncbi:MAG: hypothetical protein ACC742_03640 [Thermoanaerobaculales bacterium]
MNDRVERLEEEIGKIGATVDRLVRRVAALEERLTRAPGITEEAVRIGEEGGPPAEGKGPWDGIAGTPALAGRSLLVLAGAFLLRALTEGGTLQPGAGVALGVAYAIVWIVAAARAARGGVRGSAGFHSVCAALIAYPLLFEASTSFGVLSPTAGSAAVAAMTAAGMAVASRWRLRAAAWVFAVGALVTAVSLVVVRPPGEAATAVLVALGLACLWMADVHGWGVLRWFTALAADLGVLRLTAMATAPDGLPESFGVVHAPLVAVLQAVLVLGFVGTTISRALRGKSRLTGFDFVQSIFATAVGWGGAIRLARAQGWGVGGLFLLALVLGVAAYAGAFGVIDRRQGRNMAFLFLSSVGLALVLLGMPGVVGGASAPVWALLAVGVAAVGSHWDRVTLRVHAVVLMTAAWGESGLAVEVARKLNVRAGDLALPELEAVIIVLLTIFTTAVVLVGRRLRGSGWLQRLPLTGLLAMTAFGIAAISVWLVAGVAPEATVAVGTVILSAVTVFFAILAGRWGVVEAGWLVYPLLFVTGVHVLLHDLASGRTLVLVFTLAAYGAALILSPRLVRPGPGRAGGNASGE